MAVLDLVSRTGGDLTKRRGITGSAATRPDVDDFTRDGKLFKWLIGKIVEFLNSISKLQNGGVFFCGKEYTVEK